MSRKRLEYSFVKNQFETNGYILLSDTYENAHTYLYYICNKGHKNKIKYNHFQQGKRCPTCSNKIIGNKLRHSYDFIKSEFINRGFILLSKEYKNANSYLDYICNKGHKTKIKYGDLKQGHGCKFCAIDNRSGEFHPNWNGGGKYSPYDTFAHQLEWIEEVRRDPKNNNALQVKCTELNCKKWFTPTYSQVLNRLYSLSSIDSGGNRFYCSSNCKLICPIFKRIKYPKNFKKDKSRELQPELRDLVLQRDEHECQRCGNTSDLQCHHFEGVEQNKIESADIDNCITLCSECHRMAHEDEGCRYVDLQCR